MKGTRTVMSVRKALLLPLVTLVAVVALVAGCGGNNATKPLTANTMEPGNYQPLNVGEATVVTDCKQLPDKPVQPMPASAEDKALLAKQMGLTVDKLTQVTHTMVRCEDKLNIWVLDSGTILAVDVDGFERNCLVQYLVDRGLAKESEQQATNTFSVFCDR